MLIYTRRAAGPGLSLAGENPPEFPSVGVRAGQQPAACAEGCGKQTKGRTGSTHLMGLTSPTNTFFFSLLLSPSLLPHLQQLLSHAASPRCSSPFVHLLPALSSLNRCSCHSIDFNYHFKGSHQGLLGGWRWIFLRIMRMSEFFLVRWQYCCQSVSFERLFLHVLSACVHKKQNCWRRGKKKSPAII